MEEKVKRKTKKGSKSNIVDLNNSENLKDDNDFTKLLLTEKIEEIIPRENKRDLFCQNAVSFLGVKFEHLGRSEWGLDCAGLGIVTAIKTGIYQDGQDMYNYSRRPDGHSLVKQLNTFYDRKEISELQKGDVLLMAFDNHPCHIAIYLGDYLNNGSEYIIHAYILSRKVVIHRLDSVWKSNIVGVYSYKNID